MKSIIIYYSRTGKTKLVSETISEELGTDIVEIKDNANRSGSIGFIKGALDAVKNKKTDITPENIDLNSYERIFIGTPVWASKITPAIAQFIDSTNFKDKKVITFVTLSNKGANESLDQLNRLIKEKNGKICKSFAIITKDTGIEKLSKQAIKEMND